MKRTLIVSLLLASFAVVFPICAVSGISPAESTAETDVPEEDVPSPHTDEPAVSADAETTLSFLDDGVSRTITMEDYLIGAVAAEMPANFEPDALMAQAAALRTFVLYKMRVAPSSAHGENICGNSSCCAAWKSEAELREKWGDRYDEYIRKIYNAVKATDGVYITYGGEPVLAAFHSSSPGKTENSESVWASPLPYLVSVDSPETEEDVPGFVSSVTLSRDEFTAVIRDAYPAADLSGDTAGWISSPVYDGAGRLKTVTVGGVEIAGTKLRSLFSLRSAAVEFDCGDEITMTVTGYGHGVGMSQFGANVMAEQGSSWRDILAWYYPGTALENAEA